MGNQDSINLPSVGLAITSASQREIYRCRTNFGVNLGSCFVRESWMYGDMMNGKRTELQAVEQDISSRGEGGAREHLEQFWRNFMNGDDWSWLQSHGMNSVRIPIGYWNIGGGAFTEGTAFGGVAHVYSNSWNILKSHFIEPAAQRGISVLVDVHGLPGGANRDAHSGESEGSANFWSDFGSHDRMAEAVRFIARDLMPYENISGIQVVNEAVTEDPSNGQFDYYQKCLRAIREEDSTIPVVISDAWWANKFNEWVQDIQGPNSNVGFVVDEHCYRAYTDSDKAKSAEQITNDLDGDFLTNLRDNGKGVDFMLGEYSCVLDRQSWQRSGVNGDYSDDPPRRNLAAQFGRKQVQLALIRAPTAIYMWSYKFPGRWGEWDARVVFGEYFSAPSVSMPADGQFEQIRDAEVNNHVNYWSSIGGNYEFDRFKDGFEAAWRDCVTFASQGSRVGRKQAVKFARRQQHIEAKGWLDHLWEWEHGFDEAMKQFAANFYHF